MCSNIQYKFYIIQYYYVRLSIYHQFSIMYCFYIIFDSFWRKSFKNIFRTLEAETAKNSRTPSYNLKILVLIKNKSDGVQTSDLLLYLYLHWPLNGIVFFIRTPFWEYLGWNPWINKNIDKNMLSPNLSKNFFFLIITTKFNIFNQSYFILFQLKNSNDHCLCMISL